MIKDLKKAFEEYKEHLDKELGVEKYKPIAIIEYFLQWISQREKGKE